MVWAKKTLYYTINRVSPFKSHFSDLYAGVNVIKSFYAKCYLYLKVVIKKISATNAIFYLFLVTAYPHYAQLGFQEPVTPVMEGIIDFHHDLMFFLAFILGFVCWFLYNIGSSFFADLVLDQKKHNHYYKISSRIDYIRAPSRKNHHLWLEIIWTIIPALILVSIVLPSFALIYSMDEFFLHPRLTLKAIGNQWYWTYNYGCALEFDNRTTKNANVSTQLLSSYLSEGNPSAEVNHYLSFVKASSKVPSSIPTPSHHFVLKFDSYMKTEDLLTGAQMRLLEVDKRILLPTLTGIRLLVSSYDVLHSWAIPSFGVKLDGCPGRLNQTFLYIKKEGLFYGQCSEICGVNHAFMPIAIKTVDSDNFNIWLLKRVCISEPIENSEICLKSEKLQLNGVWTNLPTNTDDNIMLDSNNESYRRILEDNADE